MQDSANHGDPSVVVLSPQHRVAIEHALWDFINWKFDPADGATGLDAIHDRALVRGVWALEDMLAGEQWNRARVSGVIRRLEAHCRERLEDLAQIAVEAGHGPTWSRTTDEMLEALSAFDAVLAQIGDAR